MLRGPLKSETPSPTEPKALQTSSSDIDHNHRRSKSPDGLALVFRGQLGETLIPVVGQRPLEYLRECSIL